VEALLKRCRKDQLMMFYAIPDYRDANEFLLHVAQRRGLLKKVIRFFLGNYIFTASPLTRREGGVANIMEAGRAVLRDWNAGKISFYTLPPERTGIQICLISLSLSLCLTYLLTHGRHTGTGEDRERMGKGVRSRGYCGAGADLRLRLSAPA
jgi:hypothetical protein